MPLSFLPTTIISDEIILGEDLAGAKPVEFIDLDKTFMKASSQIVRYSNTQEDGVISQEHKIIDYTLYDSIIRDTLSRQNNNSKISVDANHNEPLDSNAGRRANTSYT